MHPIECRFARVSMAVAMAVCAVAFACLAVFVWWSPQSTSFETRIADAITSTKKDAAFHVFDAISVLGSRGAVAVGGVLLAVLTFWWWRNLRLAAVCVLGPLLAGLGEIAFKDAIGRPRPSTAGLSGESGFGFPSGHAAGAAAIAVVIVLLAFAAIPRGHWLRGCAVCAAVLYAVVVSVARVGVGAHFALDVIGGLLLGVTMALAVTLALLWQVRWPVHDRRVAAPAT